MHSQKKEKGATWCYLYPLRPDTPHKKPVANAPFPCIRPGKTIMMMNRTPLRPTILQNRHLQLIIRPTSTTPCSCFWYIHASFAQSPKNDHCPRSSSVAVLHHDAFAPTAACALWLFTLRPRGMAAPTVAMGVVGHFFIISSDLADDVVEGIVDVDT